jgi:exo-beta-1,3-glucanase (GH17 family)
MTFHWLRAPQRALHRFAAPALALALAATLVACGGGGYTPSPASVTDRRVLPADFTARMAVNYSPYRTSANVQDIADEVEVITYANVKQDLELIRKAGFGAIRLFSARRFGQTVLDVIRDNALDLKVQLGCYPNSITAEQAADPANAVEVANQAELAACVRLANQYSDIVPAVSVGNETMVYWATNRIPPSVMARYLRQVRDAITQPVTTDDNWAFWDKAPKVITDVVDFAAVHTYPLLDTFYDRALWDWRQKQASDAERADAMMDAAIDEAKKQFAASRAFLDRIGLKDMPMTIGETGWFAVDLEGDPAVPLRAGRVNQKMYFDRLQAWVAEYAAGNKSGPMMIFTFQAFDEPWKGADDGWGLFNKDRQARYVLQDRGTCGVTWTCEPGSYTAADAVSWVAPDYSEPAVAAARLDVFTDAVADGLRTDPFARTVGAIVADAAAPQGTNVLSLTPTPENYGWGFFFRSNPDTDTSPTPTENLSAFAGGHLKFQVKTNGYPGKLLIGISSDTDDRDVVEAFVPVENGDKYGYCNTNTWCQVSIPVADFLAVNPKIDLRLVVFRFTIADIYDRTGKPLNLTGLPAIAVDDVHWSKD